MTTNIKINNHELHMKFCEIMGSVIGYCGPKIIDTLKCLNIDKPEQVFNNYLTKYVYPYFLKNESYPQLVLNSNKNINEINDTDLAPLTYINMLYSFSFYINGKYKFINDSLFRKTIYNCINNNDYNEYNRINGYNIPNPNCITLFNCSEPHFENNILTNSGFGIFNMPVVLNTSNNPFLSSENSCSSISRVNFGTSNNLSSRFQFGRTDQPLLFGRANQSDQPLLFGRTNQTDQPLLFGRTNQTDQPLLFGRTNQSDSRFEFRRTNIPILNFGNPSNSTNSSSSNSNSTNSNSTNSNSTNSNSTNSSLTNSSLTNSSLTNSSLTNSNSTIQPVQATPTTSNDPNIPTVYLTPTRSNDTSQRTIIPDVLSQRPNTRRSINNINNDSTEEPPTRRRRS